MYQLSLDALFATDGVPAGDDHCLCFSLTGPVQSVVGHCLRQVQIAIFLMRNPPKLCVNTFARVLFV